MKSILISFADSKMSPTLFQIKKEANASGFFDEVKTFNENTFDRKYWREYKSFYQNNPRGFGYWLWKSYIIKRELSKLSEGDILVYLDAGCIINKNGKETISDM